ncbi:MAG: hypothetical protein KGJ13_13300 [Patescibacteria group bacterium]|nr:hypothetical protein [Patescibacteria group bacterium]
MLLRAGGGGGNLSTPPTGFIRIAPNQVIANPRLLLPAWNIVAGLNTYAPGAQVPSAAKYLMLTIAFTFFGDGVVGDVSGFGFHTTFDATGTNLADSGTFSFTNQAALVAGSELGRASIMRGIFPVFLVAGTPTIGLTVAVIGGTFSNVQPKLTGYYD